MYKFTKKQVEAWDKSMKGLDNMRKTKYICDQCGVSIELEELPGSGISEIRTLTCRRCKIIMRREEVKESLADKFMDSKYFLKEVSPRDLSQISNEHYEKEVVDAMNKATNGIPIPILPIQRGHLVPMDEVLKIINRIKESVADVFKDKE